MARVVRKVSNKAVVGQKKRKRKFSSKLLWSIVAAVAVIGLAVGITLGIVLNKEDESESRVDYFATCEEVTFTKASYDGVKNYINVNYRNPQNNEELNIENVFVFAYNSSTFYPDSTDEDNYNSSHKELLNKMIDLQKHIDSAAEAGKDIKLFIVDTSVGNNAEIFTSSTFGSIYSSETTSFAPMLICIELGEYKAYYEEEDGGKTVKNYISTNTDKSDGKTLNYINTTLINNVTNYILNKID